MLAELAKEVAESRSVTEGAIAFIKGLQAKIAELSTAGFDNETLRAELAALAAELNAQQGNLSAALVTGTVADATQPPPDNGIANAPNVEPVPPPADAVANDAATVEAAQPNV